MDVEYKKIFNVMTEFDSETVYKNHRQSMNMKSLCTLVTHSMDACFYVYILKPVFNFRCRHRRIIKLTIPKCNLPDTQPLKRLLEEGIPFYLKHNKKRSF